MAFKKVTAGIINYLKSLNWGREDTKKILMFIMMCLIARIIFSGLVDDMSVYVNGVTDVSISDFVSVDMSMEDKAILSGTPRRSYS